ncbi:hypothetical protein TSUD_305520 [Trifolium subterraneum]|uniref:Uncharacterized protein n=1 Tax=Trifolium subterraneum TaxID=3900 RepID=A0A2Z6MIU3_TRISU|nr:hypothetical protein TSUD_305520 [Trifolium subterraneum]
MQFQAMYRSSQPPTISIVPETDESIMTMQEKFSEIVRIWIVGGGGGGCGGGVRVSPLNTEADYKMMSVELFAVMVEY